MIQFNPIGYAPTTVNSVNQVLGMKQLAIAADASGRKLSQNGRKPIPNAALAESLSKDYRKYEVLLVRLRQIGSTSDCTGMIQYRDCVPLTPADVFGLIRQFHLQNLILSYATYTAGISVTLNPAAKSFFDKGFAQIHIAQYLCRRSPVDELYFDTTLRDVRTGDHLKVDCIYRKGGAVHFVLVCLNPNLLNMNHLLKRLTDTANRLKSNVSIVVSPSVEPLLLRELMHHLTNSNVRDVKIVKYDMLQHLK
ncbi:MAG: hypothetical protein IJY06_03825 [Oscillospiraceae bacterium]|nr:hypothetical protein [Oscillospiraceae bacterium]